ncbi:uncharacterized protein CTHT_0060980 [Thermochaetoides thermophila DSM 1495]|uniref:t-SNARE coiled-coil homology domain-containing protein n=1 Tax=Chaetomium thermophilum (strain DSM 1495 / CBS 144.50 / IMI 039719) TaxID=759272 RepID=G0SF67_CHATD|nr:hypothetical protein CTHT_0060980 [Thermochaetoides thermophila DSM 1495]EGS18083.1 hypothetical protein CTHT_0060980 [Thermochaetoides thermophila DSM 1495]
MGKFSDLFRKSSDKAKTSGPDPKSSNPYADVQPSPAADPYAANLYHNAPRPGDSRRPSPHPSEGLHGPSRTSTGESNKTPPGYPNSQIGAPGGFGQNRFDKQPPNQRPGGYGSLDTDDGSSFSRYSSLSKPTQDPNVPQHASWNGGFEGEPALQEMTEEQRIDWEYNRTKFQIKAVRNDTTNTSRNILAMARQAKAQLMSQHEIIDRDDEVIERIDDHIGRADGAATTASASINEVTKSAGMMGFIGEKQRDKRRAALAQATAEKELSYKEQRRLEDAKYQEKQQALENQHRSQKRLLGQLPERELAKARKEFMLEDEESDPEELAKEREIATNTAETLSEVQDVRYLAESLNLKINRQNDRLAKISQRTDVAVDHVGKGQRQMDILLAKK